MPRFPLIDSPRREVACTDPLPLPSSKIRGRRLLGGYYRSGTDACTARAGMDLLASGAIDTAAMTTHRFPAAQSAEAFALLQKWPGEALGVVLEWDSATG